MSFQDSTSAGKVYTNAGNPAVLSAIIGSKLRILDVGCGAGDNGARLVAQGHIVDGITLSDKEATICKNFMEKVWVFNLEQGLPSDIQEEYDYVICSHVLEHIVYPQSLLRQIRSHLKPTGKIIVALPNIMHYQSRLKLLFGNFDYEESGVWDYTHVRWYTYKTGAQLLANNGYTVIEKTVNGDIPFLSVLRFIPFRIRRKIFYGLTKISSGLFGGQLIYIAVDSKSL